MDVATTSTQPSQHATNLWTIHEDVSLKPEWRLKLIWSEFHKTYTQFTVNDQTRLKQLGKDIIQIQCRIQDKPLKERLSFKIKALKFGLKHQSEPFNVARLVQQIQEPPQVIPFKRLTKLLEHINSLSGTKGSPIERLETTKLISVDERQKVVENTEMFYKICPNLSQFEYSPVKDCNPHFSQRKPNNAEMGVVLPLMLEKGLNLNELMCKNPSMMSWLEQNEAEVQPLLSLLQKIEGLAQKLPHISLSTMQRILGHPDGSQFALDLQSAGYDLIAFDTLDEASQLKILGHRDLYVHFLFDSSKKSLKDIATLSDDHHNDWLNRIFVNLKTEENNTLPLAVIKKELNTSDQEFLDATFEDKIHVIETSRGWRKKS